MDSCTFLSLWFCFLADSSWNGKAILLDGLGKDLWLTYTELSALTGEFHCPAVDGRRGGKLDTGTHGAVLSMNSCMLDGGGIRIHTQDSRSHCDSPVSVCMNLLGNK